jgi:Mn-dependent DtxR family transcriptional regulator
MGVTKASTNSAMATLADKGLVLNEKYKEIYLTPEGLELAKFTANKHHVIRRFLIKVLDIDPDTADTDAAHRACISSASVAGMINYMEHRKENRVRYILRKYQELRGYSRLYTNPIPDIYKELRNCNNSAALILCPAKQPTKCIY